MDRLIDFPFYWYLLSVSAVTIAITPLSARQTRYQKAIGLLPITT